MEFDIRVYVHDIYEQVIQVANEVRIAIVKRFGNAGVEMALPQRVLHLADIDRLDAESRRARPIDLEVEETGEKAGGEPRQNR